MQMHAMNHGGRGFGGQPQPQRQGGRRGGRGAFRPSRFDQNNQRNPNQGQQRINEIKPNEQPQNVQQQKVNNPPTKQDDQPNKPAVQNQQQVKPAIANQQQNKPNQPANNPMQQQAQQNKPPQPQQKQQPQQQKPQQQINKQPQINNTPQQNQQNQPKPLMNNLIEKMDVQNDQPNNANGNAFGGPNRGSWNQGQKPPGQGNRSFNQQGQSQGGQNQGGQNQGGQGQGRNFGGPGGQRNNRNNPRQMGDKPPQQREEMFLANKLKDLAGPLYDLPPLEQEEMKFNGRSRLYIGNLPTETTEEELTKMFSQFGETAELFFNKEKNFGFIKMDYRVNAERAKRELDGKMINNRTMRVRITPHNSAIHVKNLPPFVSNELLYCAFEIFGKIERAYVKVDERGKTLGEGVVEYARKPSAMAAVRNCGEKCFFLTSSLRPVIVEMLEEPDEFDGFPEKNIPKKHPEYMRSREVGPRFAEPSSFEHEYGTRWKQLHELHKQKEEALKKELASEEEKLEAQMEYAKYEHETEVLRQQLRQREQDRERQKRSWEMAERAADERRDHDRELLLRQEEQLQQRMKAQDDELRRRQQENTLFVQAQRLNSMLDRQEQNMFNPRNSPMDGGFRDKFDMGGRGFEEMQPNRGWEGPRNIEDFPNKRRRF